MKQEIKGYIEGIGEKEIFIYIGGIKYQVIEAKVVEEV